MGICNYSGQGKQGNEQLYPPVSSLNAKLSLPSPDCIFIFTVITSLKSSIYEQVTGCKKRGRRRKVEAKEEKRQGREKIKQG